MRLAKLAAVTLIKNEDEALVLYGPKTGSMLRFLDCHIQLLDRCDNHLCFITELTNQRLGVDGTVNAALLETIKFSHGLVIEVFPVDHKDDFMNFI